MRLFFAGDLPEAQRMIGAELQERLKPLGGDVKWVAPPCLHITLRFIGEVPGKLLPRLEQIGREVGRLYGSFDVSLKGLGVFPSKGPPRVVWMGIEDGKSQLSMVAQALDSRLSKLKIKMEEREFRPHITLGRLKTPQITPELQSATVSDQTASEPWHFKRFTLKESRLSPSGPAYKDLCTFELAPRERVIREKESERWSHRH